MRPIFHLSFPVRDLEEAAGFYQSILNGVIGRREASFTDVLLFGAQITLQNDPGAVTAAMPRSRHFGATIGWDAWQAMAGRLAETPWIVEAPTVSYAGEPREQAKMMLRDPSGNLIEIKAYRRPNVVLPAGAVS